MVVSVQDSGPGLDVEDLDRLFEAFYTTKPGGMGMGLSISRSVIEAHGGRIWASRNVGPGATFQFTVPVASTPEADAWPSQSESNVGPVAAAERTR